MLSGLVLDRYYAGTSMSIERGKTHLLMCQDFLAVVYDKLSHAK